jgi:hypothetical protein
MGKNKGLAAVLKRLRVEREQEEATAQREKAAKERAVAHLISKGPPAGSKISSDAWRTWYVRGYVLCPGSKGQSTCSNRQCRVGAACQKLHSLGLSGDFAPLPRKKRPVCAARNRHGKPCHMRVEPGKRRCRFHGGLSTGPKTVAGRQRIAEAQRRRWKAFREARARQEDDYLYFWREGMD